jgi:hypothetical protein
MQSACKQPNATSQKSHQDHAELRGLAEPYIPNLCPGCANRGGTRISVAAVNLFHALSLSLPHWDGMGYCPIAALGTGYRALQGCDEGGPLYAEFRPVKV